MTDEVHLDAIKARLQAVHKISDADAAVLLTGEDVDTLMAQAARLGEREAEHRRRNNVSPREGGYPRSRPTGPMREFTGQMFERALADGHGKD